MTSERSETWLLTSGYLQGYGVRVLRLPLDPLVYPLGGMLEVLLGWIASLVDRIVGWFLIRMVMSQPVEPWGVV